MPQNIRLFGKETSMAQTFTTCCKILFLSFAITGGAFAQSTQSQTDSERAEKRAREGLRRREIPEATLPSSADEAKWWSDVRSAGAAVRSTMGSKKETKKFLSLLAEGREKSFRPPIPDRGDRRVAEKERQRLTGAGCRTATGWNCRRSKDCAGSRLWT